MPRVKSVSDKMHRYKLRQWRRSQNLTIEDMRALLSCSHGTYQNWELGLFPIRPDAMDLIVSWSSLSPDEINKLGKGEENELKKRAKKILSRA
jgi:transcriptional regulator with XRE-family HTH domain